MALHDWSKTLGWEGVHHMWMADLARDLRANLPPGYRVYIETTPLVISPGSVKMGVAAAQEVPRPAPPEYEERPIPEPEDRKSVV